MPDHIESRTFRRAARRNCIEYLGLLIYTTNIPALQSHSFPSFRTQSPNGAVSQLFSTLVNMNTQISQIRAGLRMSDAHPIPGVSWDDAENMTLNLSGSMYFENASQYEEFRAISDQISKVHGWTQYVSEKLSSAVYRPSRNDFSNMDPVQAAVKGMVLGAASEAADAFTVFRATDSIEANSEAEKKYFAARDRLNGGSTFNMMALQYYSNTPLSVQTSWQGAHAPRLLVDNEEVLRANIGYLPTNLTVTPAAYVQDSTGKYPSRVDLSVSLANPLGGILANFTNEGDADVDEANNAITSRSYTKDIPGVDY